MAGIQEEALEDFEINEIKESSFENEIIRQEQISIAKRSFGEKEKNSSSKTIFSIVNTMVGSSVVVFGMQFQNTGLLSSLFVAIIIGIISYKTCVIQLIHFRLDEADLPDAINRILGRKWYLLYISSSFFLLFLVGIIYFSLNMNMLYASLAYILENCSDFKPPAMKTIDFTQFSYQYAGLIGICIQFILFNIKNLKIIIKLSVLGIVAVISFIIYSIYRAGVNYENFSSVKLYDTDPMNYILLLGIYSLSFFVHNVILPIMKNNRDHTKNTRDLGIGFFFTGMVFVFLGSFGALALAGQDLKDKNTFFDFFPTTWLECILRVLLWIQLQTVLPILWYVSRTHFFNIFYDLVSPPHYMIQGANIVFGITCYIIQALNVNPSLLISIAGSLGGFTLMYILPIKLHLKCLKDTAINSMDEKLMDDEDKVLPDTYADNGNNNFGRCRSFHEGIISRMSYRKRKIFYSLLIIFGIAVMLAQFLQIYDKNKS